MANSYKIVSAIAIVAAIWFFFESMEYKKPYQEKLKEQQEAISTDLESNQEVVKQLIDTLYITQKEFVYITKKANNDLQEDLFTINDTTYTDAELRSYLSKYEKRADSVQNARQHSN